MSHAHMQSIPDSARIAIVEDDDAIRTLLEDLLESEGYRCLAGASLDSGLELIERQQPDLLILDVVLGGRATGWILLDQLVRNPHTAAIPVIVCTADTLALLDQQAVLRERGIHWLTKPFDVLELLHLVKDSLRPVSPTADSDGRGVESTFVSSE